MWNNLLCITVTVSDTLNIYKNGRFLIICASFLFKILLNSIFTGDALKNYPNTANCFNGSPKEKGDDEVIKQDWDFCARKYPVIILSNGVKTAFCI